VHLFLYALEVIFHTLRKFFMPVLVPFFGNDRASLRHASFRGRPLQRLIAIVRAPELFDDDGSVLMRSEHGTTA